MLLPYFLGAMNILISDSNQSHAETCSTYVQTYCPTANITIRLESLSSSVTWAIDNDINIISRSLTGMSDSYQALGAQAYADSGLGIVMAHGANTHTEYGNPSYLGYIVTVGCGTSGINTGSYGYGLEMFVDGIVYESWATASVAGMIGQLMINHSWTFNQARQALRQTASNWTTGWEIDGGFGYVDYASADVLETVALYSINCIYSVDMINNWSGYVNLDWFDYFSSSWDVSVIGYSADFDSTVVASDYNRSHIISDAVTFNIIPDGGRVESYSRVSASVSANVPLGTVLYLRPNEDVTISDLANFRNPSSGTYYSHIDEEVLNTEDFLWNSVSGLTNYGIFGFPDYAGSGTINSVTVKAYMVGDDFASNTADIDMYISSTRYAGISADGIFVNTLFDNEWLINPNTLTAWTWSDINNLEIYLELYSEYDEGTNKCYQLWVEVDYDAVATPAWSNKICGVNNAATINGVSTANIKSVMGVE